MSHEQYPINFPEPQPKGKPLRYLSVCSGMEAASVAWHPLGWTPVGFSEIEPFPCAILKHRFPNVPNYGSLTEYQSWPLTTGDVDILVGGCPCQSFSVAGLRKGMQDPRGNLTLTYLGLADKLKPKWIVYENVPGLLSSNGGRDFGAFLGALGQLGYGWAYRILDAQHFRGTPQRRRRVFVVACRNPITGLGDWRAAAEVLSIAEGLRWHLASGGKKRKGVAADAGSGVEANGLQRTVGTLCADTHPGAYTGQDAHTGRLIPQTFTPSSFAQYSEGIGTIRANGGDLGGGSEGLVVSQDPHAVGQPLVMRESGQGFWMEDDKAGTLRAEGENRPSRPSHVIGQAIPFRKSKRAQSVTDNETWVLANSSNTLNNFDLGDTRTTHAVIEPISIQGTIIGRSENAGPQGTGATQGGPMFTLTKTDVHGVAQYIEPILFEPRSQDGHARICNGVSPTLNTAQGGQRQPCVAFPIAAAAFKSGQGAAARSIGWDEKVSPTLPANAGGNTAPAVIGTMTSMAVRRLTPNECYRLQGFPDNWGRIPWKGKPAEECPDGPQYKAAGNSMAVPCMFFIGNGIAEYEAKA